MPKPHHSPKRRHSDSVRNRVCRILKYRAAELDVLFNDNQASVRINPLPFVSTVDSVETPRGSGAQRTVKYSICIIVPVPPKKICYHVPGGGS